MGHLVSSLSEKGSFKNACFLKILESLEILESSESLENQGVLENLENLETLEIPAHDAFCDDPFLSVPSSLSRSLSICRHLPLRPKCLQRQLFKNKRFGPTFGRNNFVIISKADLNGEEWGCFCIS